MTTALVFTSKFGATRTAAEYIAKALDADLFDLKQGSPSIADHDTVIFGSGIYMGRMPRSMRAFISACTEAIAGKKVAVFVCCTLNGEKAEKQLAAVTESMCNVEASAYLCSKQKRKGGIDMEAADAFIGSV
ncbi:MAG: flavodoxin domain-containing protein, partial [Methanomassiliicoccaceae archaeon]|nr:flavodoxin domain-containing protein [Methanomassiliicoccaceae archaeon]